MPQMRTCPEGTAIHQRHEAISAVFSDPGSGRGQRGKGRMNGRKETVEEFLARGGRITVMRTPPPAASDPSPPTIPKPADASCVCCGRTKGHRHWCLHNPASTPLDPVAPPQPPSDQACVRCGLTLRKQTTKQHCTPCLLAIRTHTKLCLVCG